MPRVVRIGDSGSHGGVVTTGSPDTFANDREVARIGDTYGCPIHGPNPIVTGSPDTFANSRAVARVGDATACGATLTTGSPDTYCN
jgi:uncharacterized Zn-binding protein involved in type VI secretion